MQIPRAGVHDLGTSLRLIILFNAVISCGYRHSYFSSTFYCVTMFENGRWHAWSRDHIRGDRDFHIQINEQERGWIQDDMTLGEKYKYIPFKRWKNARFVNKVIRSCVSCTVALEGRVGNWRLIALFIAKGWQQDIIAVRHLFI